MSGLLFNLEGHSLSDIWDDGNLRCKTFSRLRLNSFKFQYCICLNPFRFAQVAHSDVVKTLFYSQNQHNCRCYGEVEKLDFHLRREFQFCFFYFFRWRWSTPQAIKWYVMIGSWISCDFMNISLPILEATQEKSRREDKTTHNQPRKTHKADKKMVEKKAKDSVEHGNYQLKLKSASLYIYITIEDTEKM